MEHIYHVSGMTCEACTKVIANVVAGFPGASLIEADPRTGRLAISHAEGEGHEILKAIAEKGYPTRSQAEVDASSNSAGFSYISGVLAGKQGFAVEHVLLDQALFSFLIITTIGIASILFLSASAGLGLIFILLAFAVSVNGFAIWHSVAYSRVFTCTSGMMVGMTLGMMSGFMAGALLGATNGMFVGSAVGMLLGMIVGAYSGKCCGIMGVLEGLMAGIMAGIMGAMTTVMLFNDHLIEFLFILFAACGIVLAGLSYMIYKEAGGKHAKAPDFATVVLLNAAVAIVLIVLMIFGPKGPLVWSGT